MRRLCNFRPLSEYRYVGMGGYEFVDFDLVHRALGIHRMTSIENRIDEARLKFNRPILEVDIRIGTSNEMLPTIPLDPPLVVWMDYCCKMRHDVIQDALLLGEQLQAGSMLVMTVNAEAGVVPEERLAKLEGRVGVDRVPMDVTEDKHLDGWLTAEVQRRILLTALKDGLAKRNDSMRFEQVLNFQYGDTNRMQAVGGVFVDPSHDAKFAAADFPSLEYVRTAEDALRINVPLLTAREVLDLESKLKKGSPTPNFSWLKDGDADSFAEFHRWYPPSPAPM